MKIITVKYKNSNIKVRTGEYPYLNSRLLYSTNSSKFRITSRIRAIAERILYEKS